MNETTRTIRFNSSRFGDIEIPEEKIISVPDGIIGFPDFRRYALLDSSSGASLFLWLHSVDSPDLAFVITDPTVFVPDFKIQTSEPALERLDLQRKSAPALFVITTIPENDPDRVSINLLAPLLYFADENSLYQIILEQTDRPLRFYLLASTRSGNEPSGAQEGNPEEAG